MYCKDRGRTSCCFQNEACEANYTGFVNDHMLRQSITFLKNPKVFLENMVQNLTYDTCHDIHEYDASICAADCENMEKSQFSQNCTRDGGLYKCCIRYCFCKDKS